MIPDLSDEGLVAQFGDILFEIPELFEALKRFEVENRPAVTSGGFGMRCDRVTVDRSPSVLRFRIGASVR
ncbi:hypothetical protein J2X71_000295 [Rhizobium sp. 1399]|nr:hypothetical protein [Rhizobium sp. BK456]MDR6664050.1 hypothetical protein [Rhizobium sp. 1399]